MDQIAEITWEQLTEIEPGLARLQAEADAVRDPGGESFCANRLWVRRFKPRLVQLVGWNAVSDDPRIRTAEAYDLAYKKCYFSLPDCRNCNCL